MGTPSTTNITERDVYRYVLKKRGKVSHRIEKKISEGLMPREEDLRLVGILTKLISMLSEKI